MLDTKVSVVIATLNSAETLEMCLASIKKNASRYKYEVIVVDAGSTDKTIEIAKKYADKTLAGLPSRVNRNQGVKAAKGDIICFTDRGFLLPALTLHRERGDGEGYSL